VESLSRKDRFNQNKFTVTVVTWVRFNKNCYTVTEVTFREVHPTLVLGSSTRGTPSTYILRFYSVVWIVDLLVDWFQRKFLHVRGVMGPARLLQFCLRLCCFSFILFMMISILLASARGRIPLGSGVNCFVTFIYFALPLAVLSCLIARERSGIVMNSGLVRGIREFVITGWGVWCWFQNAILGCGLVKVGVGWCRLVWVGVGWCGLV